MPRPAVLVVLAVVGLLGLASAHAAAAGAHGAPARIESFELPSEQVDTAAPGGKLQSDRTVPKVNVLLPAGYDDHPRRRYPLLWLLHGANGGTDNWIPGITDLAAGLPAVVVMPDGGVFGMYTDWWNEGARGDPAWATYHLQTLREEVEARYRVKPGRRWRAIAGISMGGQGALRYAALLPGYFGSVVGFSAALPDMQSDTAQLLSALSSAGITYEAIFGPPAGAYAEGNSPQALASNYGHTRVYLTSGDGTNCPQDPSDYDGIVLDRLTEKGIHAQQAPFADAVRSAGAHVSERTTCGVHTWGVWNRAFAAARAWRFWKRVPERPRQWTYRTVAASGEMWGLRFAFDEPPTSIAEFTRAGRTLAGTGSGQVAIEGGPGCSLSAELPFELPLPKSCP